MKTGSTSINVFLSHSHLDKSIVQRIGNDLGGLGCYVWLDEERTLAGDSIPDCVVAGIQACDIFIVFLSESSIQSSWVKKELRIALKKREQMGSDFKIIPVLLENCELPVALEDDVYVDFSISKEYFTAISFLADSIIFSDRIFNKYKKFNPGFGLVEELIVDVAVSGESQDIVIINEKHVVKPFKNTNKYIKRLTLDGELLKVCFDKGKVEKRILSRSDVELDMTVDDQFKIGIIATFEITFVIKDEFIYEPSWFYSIDSPTKSLKVNFRFDEKCNVSNLYTKHLRALGEVNEDFTSNITRGKGAKANFQCVIDFPSYRDRYKFYWS